MTMPAKTDRNALRLRAEDQEDLSVIASLLQDSLVPVVDMALLPDEGEGAGLCFAMILTRFCWENSSVAKQASVSARVHSLFTIYNVRTVQYTGIERSNPNLILSLLTVRLEKDNILTIYFAGGSVIRAEVDSISCVLKDITEPWPTKFHPEHQTGSAFS